MPAALHPLAEVANAALAKDTPVVLELLSERGKRMFFPTKGILAQGAEAKSKASFANATVGIATENGAPMHLACINQYYNNLKPAEIYDYAPSFGKPDLRAAWAAKQRQETPSLGDHATSLPVVTNALTHGLSLIGDLFLDPGDEALSSDLMWENYNLSWETRLGARISTYPFFDKNLTGFNITAFTQALAERKGRKLVVALNFPNNPSGYTPTRAEAGAIVSALTAADLGVDHYLATDLEMIDGLFTGRTQGVLNMRTGKVERLRAWLLQQGQPESVLKQASFHTDSINDLPLLSVVRRPVVVDPDPRLESAALRTGWQVLRFER